MRDRKGGGRWSCLFLPNLSNLGGMVFIPQPLIQIRECDPLPFQSLSFLLSKTKYEGRSQLKTPTPAYKHIKFFGIKIVNTTTIVCVTFFQHMALSGLRSKAASLWTSFDIPGILFTNPNFLHKRTSVTC